MLHFNYLPCFCMCFRYLQRFKLIYQLSQVVIRVSTLLYSPLGSITEFSCSLPHFFALLATSHQKHHNLHYILSSHHCFITQAHPKRVFLHSN
ncbi:hypothetical protein VIGAN_04125200 [Vigna angularis var. angularis]|uniref:Uncharacterized protein n=1 Tax=Vigna angularis var. angularis TaxID=157739 RepID=A0A0S3RTS4_PHAAN|nr:hypothetical protein VIGAN_04125200 [Vigna angularis var. angularis]